MEGRREMWREGRRGGGHLWRGRAQVGREAALLSPWRPSRRLSPPEIVTSPETNFQPGDSGGVSWAGPRAGGRPGIGDVGGRGRGWGL